MSDFREQANRENGQPVGAGTAFYRKKEPIPAAELSAFREVVNAATKGPWVVEPWSLGDFCRECDEYPCKHQAELLAQCRMFDVHGPEPLGDGGCSHFSKGDARFIAQSREMCGRLLDYVDWLRARNEDHTDWLRGRNQNMVALKRVIRGELKAECVSRDSFEREIAEIFKDVAKSLGEYIAALRDERDAVRAEAERLKAALAAKGGE